MLRNLVFSLLPLCAPALLAAERVDSVIPPQQLEQLVVTGTRTPKTLAQTPVLTQLITRQAIEKTDATNLQSLLQQVMPGVEFSFAMNQQTHMNLSGFGGQNILILVDGERLAGETMDDVDFTRLMTDNIDHIEIVKGAASALYGSNANGGVINIITRKAVHKYLATLSAHTEKHGIQRYSVQLENSGSKWGNTLTVNRTAADNYDLKNGDNPRARVISTVFGDKTWHFDDHLLYSPVSNLELKARAGYFFRQTTRSYLTPERYRDFTGGLQAVYKPDARNTLEAAWTFDQYDKSELLRQQHLDVRSYSNVQNAARLVYTHHWGDNDFTLGADYLYDYLLNQKLNGTHHQQSVDAYAQLDYRINPRWELVPALRYDYFSQGAVSRLTPKLSVQHTPLKNLHVRFGYGMGFRAPSLKERYYNFDMVGIWLIEGNPDLKPEVSHNFNLSTEYLYHGYNFTANIYYNRVRNKITSGNPYYASADDQMPRLPYINVSRYSVWGIDLQAMARYSWGLTARVNYAYVNEGNYRVDGELVARPYLPARKNSVTVHADYDHQFSTAYGMCVTLDARWLQGITNQEFKDYYDVSKGTQSVYYPAYTIVKLGVQNRIGKRVKLNVSLDNLFNYRPRYYYLNSIITDGINLQLTAQIKLGK